MRQVVSKGGNAYEANLNGFNFDSSVDIEASKCHLHLLFGLLVKAISQEPAMLFLDDLHWADQASLDLMTALVHGVGHSSEDSRVMFVGCYRSNEVSDLDPLKISLRQISSLSNVTLTEIPLNGLSRDNVNVMISDALRYPRRLTKSLADVVHEKSIGNPLFVKEVSIVCFMVYSWRSCIAVLGKHALNLSAQTTLEIIISSFCIRSLSLIRQLSVLAHLVAQ